MRKHTASPIALFLLFIAVAAVPLGLGQQTPAAQPQGKRSGPRQITAEERQKMEAALPGKALARPKTPRRLLVVDTNMGRGGHPAIPYTNLAVELLGKKTGAFEATISHDTSMLEPDSLRQFDALYLNNAAGDLFDTPAKQEGLLAFLREGKGLMANHAATIVSPKWEEFGEVLGARGASHRAQDEKLVVKVDDARSPLVAVFGGKSFEFVDEFFRYQEPYSREKVRVLLSVDTAKSDLNQGKCAGQCSRPDDDYALAWVRSYGKGRVYYSSFGHGPEPFFDSRILAHWLAAIQFVLGDLEANTAPSVKAAGR